MRNIETRIRSAWNRRDADAAIRVDQREDGKLAVTLISTAFDGLDSFEREALFWPVMRDLPNDILVRMAYSLLLTPDEADRYFADEVPGERTPI